MTAARAAVRVWFAGAAGPATVGADAIGGAFEIAFRLELTVVADADASFSAFPVASTISYSTPYRP